MSGWSGDELDLEAYLSRIGFSGERAPSEETLHRLHRAHVTSIPFENADILLGRPILLDLASLQAKLVRRRRGGYCFEHTVLFAAALERLGFEPTALSGRVTLGADTPRPATHAVLRVKTADTGRVWLCDVGFGRGPLEPIELIDGTEADQDGWRYRLRRHTVELDTEEWTLYQHGTEGWIDRHRFTLNPQYLIDYVVGNHFVSTHPKSPFTTRLYAQSFSVERHHVIDGPLWTTELPDGTRQERKLDPTEIPEVLADSFDIILDAQERQATLHW